MRNHEYIRFRSGDIVDLFVLFVSVLLLLAAESGKEMVNRSRIRRQKDHGRGRNNAPVGSLDDFPDIVFNDFNYSGDEK